MHQGSLKKLSNCGVTVVEVLIGAAITATMVIMVLLTMTLFLNSRTELMTKTASLYAAEAGLETMRYLRDENWNSFALLSYDTPLYLAVATATIAISGTPEVLADGLVREVYVRRVYRNATTRDIVSSTTSGGVVDAGSREVEVRVGDGRSTTSLSTILTNIHDI